MNPFVGRGLAAVGAVLAVVAIWVKLTDVGGKYWDSEHHVVGIVMLVLAILVGAGIVLASTLQNRAIDQLWLIPALVLGGLQFFLPLSALGAGNADHLSAGSWLGIGGLAAFVIAGILNAIPEPAPRQAFAPAAAAPAAIAPAVAGASPTLPPNRKPEPVAAPAESSSPPADWYPDPTGQARLRYWDGNQWTDNTSP